MDMKGDYAALISFIQNKTCLSHHSVISLYNNKSLLLQNDQRYLHLSEFSDKFVSFPQQLFSKLALTV